MRKIIQRRFALVAAASALVSCGVATVLFGGQHLAATVALAIVNLLLAFGAIAYYARRGALAWSPVIFFLPGIAVSWPLTTVYFAIFSPEAEAIDGGARVLQHADRLQVSVFVFLCAYLAAGVVAQLIHPARKARDEGERRPEASRLFTRIDEVIIAAGAVAVTAGWVAAVPGVPVDVSFVLNATRNYFSPLMFVAGYHHRRVPRWLRLAVLGAMALSLAVHTLANSRGYALWPFVLFAAGYCVSPLQRRGTIRRLALLGIVAFPAYMIVGNQTRAVFGTVGLTDVSDRAAVLSEAMRGEVAADGPMLDPVMLRLFSSGGNALVAANWDSRVGFDADEFASDLIAGVLPSFAGGRKSGRYFGSSVLSSYGFTISDETSVDTSLVGSLVYAGGPFGLALGASLIGALHVVLARCVAARAPRGGVPLGLTAVFVSGTAWAYNTDLVMHVRGLLWSAVYVSALYGVARGVVLLFAHSRRRAIGSAAWRRGAAASVRR